MDAVDGKSIFFQDNIHTVTAYMSKTGLNFTKYFTSVSKTLQNTSDKFPELNNMTSSHQFQSYQHQFPELNKINRISFQNWTS